MPATRNNPLCPNICVLDGYNVIVQYARQFPEIQVIEEHFLDNYILGFWINQIGPEKFSVFGEDHRTNNNLESFHSTLLKQMGTHPNIWDFLRKLLKLLLISDLYVIFLFQLFLCLCVLCLCYIYRLINDMQ